MAEETIATENQEETEEQKRSTEESQETQALEEKGAENQETEESDDKETKSEEQKQRKRSIDDRVRDIHRKTAEMREQERRLIEERQRWEEAKKSAPDLKKPKIDDYDDQTKYEADVEEYYTKRSEKIAQEKAEAMAAASQQKQTQSQINQGWDIAREKELENNPDFEVSENRVQKVLELYRASHIAQAIVEARDEGVKLVNYLAKNLDSAEDIARMSPMKGLIELGKVASKLNKKSEKNVSSAPPPASKDKGGAASGSWKTMSQAEYNKKMNNL